MSDQRPNGDNLINFIATTVETMRDQMATKDDLVKLATKDDLVKLATKDDLSRLEITLRGDFEQVQLRLDSIDRAISTRMGQIETEVSRLRSVLYLLVKDKPDMLRLLGSNPPAGDGNPQL